LKSDGKGGPPARSAFDGREYCEVQGNVDGGRTKRVGRFDPGGNEAKFDNFKVGYDNNSNWSLDDAGDSLLVDENFDSTDTTAAYCKAGNLIDDGKFQFVYDAPALDTRPSAKGANRSEGKAAINCSRVFRRVQPFLKDRSLCRAWSSVRNSSK
jgi:hypothetical protein